MFRQSTLASFQMFRKFHKKTRLEVFLEEMDKLIPWKELCKTLEPFYYSKFKKGPGRRPVGLERMLRIHFLQHWFQFSDPAVEEALYNNHVMCRFVGIDLGREPVPDETTICKFRHMMEEHGAGEKMFEFVKEYLEACGVRVKQGTIVDATIIHAPTSTKNKNKQRDPEMGFTKKKDQLFFGMKAHVGVDSQTKQIHSVKATSASVHDSAVVGDLLHGEEKRVYGDKAYSGKKEEIRKKAPLAKDFTQKKKKRGKEFSLEEKEKNRRKGKIRLRVEHVFQVMKKKFGFEKVRYKGLRKNEHWLFITCALTNIYIARKQLLSFT